VCMNVFVCVGCLCIYCDCMGMGECVWCFRNLYLRANMRVCV